MLVGCKSKNISRSNFIEIMNFIFVEIFFQNDTKKGKRKLENKLENINVKNFLIAVFITELRILK